MDVVLRVIPFFLLITVGVGIARAKLIDLAGARALSAYVFWVAFPALLIHSLSHAPAPDARMAVSLGVYAVAMAAPILVALGLGKALGWTAASRAGAGMAAIVGNTAFLGAPLAVSVLGASSAIPAAAVVAVDCSVIMAIATGVLRSAAHQGGWRAMTKLIASHPLVIAAVVGVALSFAHLLPPAPVDQTLALLRATASPVGLVALGVVVGLEAGHSAKGEATPVGVAVALKVLLAPILVWLALTAIGADPAFRATATLLAACPTAVSVFIQTRTSGVFAQGGAMVVVLSTLVCVVTLPLLGAALTR